MSNSYRIFCFEKVSYKETCKPRMFVLLKDAKLTITLGYFRRAVQTVQTVPAVQIIVLLFVSKNKWKLHKISILKNAKKILGSQNFIFASWHFFPSLSFTALTFDRQCNYCLSSSSCSCPPCHPACHPATPPAWLYFALLPLTRQLVFPPRHQNNKQFTPLAFEAPDLIRFRHNASNALSGDLSSWFLHVRVFNYICSCYALL